MNSYESDEPAEGGAYTEFFSWGNASKGQLGHGSDSKQFRLHTPKSFSFNVLIKQVTAGQTHSLFLTQGGKVFSFGDNSHGQLGISHAAMTTTSDVPLSI